MSVHPKNPFVEGPLPLAYARTALPIIFVMGMNGALAIVDALFLGRFVGPEALAAVTLMFPVYMLIVALATLVSSGMSSLLARHLGAGRRAAARAVFCGAHGLALTLGGLLVTMFYGLGDRLSLLAAGGSADLAAMGLVYLRITVLFSPLLFVLSVNSDALRNEGRLGFMAATSLLVSLANIGFDFVLIVLAGLGVAGSALATVLAQTLALAILALFRWRGATALPLTALTARDLTGGWRGILALGAPQSLNFIGLALGSGAIVAALQIVDEPGYQDTVSAYGIVTRVLTFGFLPLLGLSQAMQTITGNNFGARNWRRADASLKFAIVAALVYCAGLQALLGLNAARIGAAFVADPAVVAEVARILPLVTMVLTLSGPLMMIAMHFQAVGEAGRAALLALAKPYLFALPLTFLLPLCWGETGIWTAGPVAEMLLLALTATLLTRAARRDARPWGLFRNTKGGAA